MKHVSSIEKWWNYKTFDSSSISSISYQSLLSWALQLALICIRHQGFYTGTRLKSTPKSTSLIKQYQSYQISFALKCPDVQKSLLQRRQIQENPAVNEFLRKQPVNHNWLKPQMKPNNLRSLLAWEVAFVSLFPSPRM